MKTFAEVIKKRKKAADRTKRAGLQLHMDKRFIFAKLGISDPTATFEYQQTLRKNRK